MVKSGDEFGECRKCGNNNDDKVLRQAEKCRFPSEIRDPRRVLRRLLRFAKKQPPGRSKNKLCGTSGGAVLLLRRPAARCGQAVPQTLRRGVAAERQRATVFLRWLVCVCESSIAQARLAVHTHKETEGVHCAHAHKRARDASGEPSGQLSSPRAAQQPTTVEAV